MADEPNVKTHYQDMLDEVKSLKAYCVKLQTALAERDKELTAATKIVESQEAQILRLAGEKEQATTAYEKDLAYALKQRNEAEARVDNLLYENEALVKNIGEMDTKLAAAREGLKRICKTGQGITNQDAAKILVNIAERTLERMG